jgi:hypothetical protein
MSMRFEQYSKLQIVFELSEVRTLYVALQIFYRTRQRFGIIFTQNRAISRRSKHDLTVSKTARFLTQDQNCTMYSAHTVE